MNEYDEIVSPPKPPENTYGPLVQDSVNDQKTALQSSMFVASKTDPDRAAQVQQLAAKTNLPPAVVDRNLEDVARKNVVARNDYDSLVQNLPKTSDWLSNPDNASVASDDVHNLGTMESAVDEHSLLSSMYSGLHSGMMGLLANAAKVPALAVDTANLGNKLVGGIATGVNFQSPEWLRNNPVSKYFDQKALESQPPEMAESISSAIGKGNYGRAARIMAVQFAANAPQQAAIVASTLGGFGVPALIGAGAITAAQANAENQQNNEVSPEMGTADALTKGVIESGFESIGTFGILKHWENAIASQWGKQVSKEVFKDFAKTIGYSVAGEANEEFLTSGAQDLTDYLTGVNPNGLKGMLSRAVDAGIVGGFSGGVMTGPSAIAAGVARGQGTRQAALAKDFYTAMGNAAEASALRERMPEAQKNFIDHVTQGTGVQNVYISPEAIDSYFQSAKENPVAAMQKIGALDAYTQAKESGADVQIPLSTWIDKVVGTTHYQGLANDIKFSPGTLSVNEAKAHEVQTQAQMQEAAKQAQADNELPQNQLDESARVVRDTIAKQLEAAGQDPQAAIIHQEYFKSLGQRLGVNPLKLFNDYRLGVEPNFGTASDENGQLVRLNQEGTYGPLPAQEEIEQLRKRVAELENESRLSPVTGLRNAKAFEEDAKLGWPTVAAMDMDGLKRLNDTAGHENADNVLKALGAALLKAQGEGDNVRFYHRSGDEFAGRFKSPEQAQAFMENLQQQLENVDVQFHRNGVHETTYQGIGLSFGVGENYEKADQAANEQKKQRLAEGKREDARAPGTPRRLVRVTENQTEGQNRDKTGQPQTPVKTLKQGPRAQIDLTDSGAIIRLSKASDASSFFHESGHYFLEVLKRAAESKEAPRQVVDDYNTLREWVGAKPGEALTTEQHEQFARGFEAYLMEGKAPSSALQKAFARFRVWLTQVYKSLRNLNVELTPEVRGVMDRLLATDEEIANARQLQNYEPLFSDPNKFGLTGAKAERYQLAVTEAKEAAEAELSRKIMADYNRERQAAWKEERARIQPDIEKQVNSQPVYIAESVLRTGKMPDGSEPAPGLPTMKLSRQELEKSFKPGLLAKLPKGITTKENGFNPDVAASLFGFGSGAEMVVQLAAAEPRKALIERLTDEKMKELHPSLLTPENISDEAMKAIHNDKQAQLMRMELEHLAQHNLPALKDMIRQLPRRLPTTEEIKRSAARTVGAQAVSDIKPFLYERAEAKMNKQAGELAAKGDFQGVFEAKQKALFNHELYKAAVNAQDDTAKTIRQFKKIVRANPDDTAKTRDMDLVNGAKAVLAQFGLGKSDSTPDSYLESLRRYDPDTYETIKALVDSATQNPGDYRKISYNDFTDLKNTVDALWNLAKTTRQIEIDGQKVDRDQVIMELNYGITDRMKPGKKSVYDRATSKWDRTKLGLLGIRAALRRVESWADSMDGGDHNGAFRRYLWNPVSQGTANYRVAKGQYIQKYLDLLKPIESRLTQEEILAPELGYRFSGKAELLGAILHTGNQSNLQKLLRGRNWGTIDINGNIDTNRWDAFLVRMYKEGTLTKEDYDFAQGVWGLMEELKPMIQKAHKAMYGFHFNEITAQPVNTPFGIYRGGYVPAKVDPFLNLDAAARVEKELFERTNNSYAFPTTGRGATKNRIEAYAAPLQLDLRFLASHIDWALRFAHIEPTVKAAARIVMNKAFRNQLDALDPAAVSDMLVPWLQRAAQQRVEESSKGWGGKAADTIFREMRRRTGLNIMAANVSNTLQQLTGLSITAVKVPPKYLRNALWDFVRGPKSVTDSVNEASDFMRSRVTAQTFEIQNHIDDLLLNPSKYEQALRFATKHGYVLQAAFQNVVDVITWHGAYNHAIDTGAEGLAAVRQADSAVRQTQGSFNAEDVSRFETGTPMMRAFTMFYSYFNMQANLLGTEFANIARDMGLRKGAGRALYVYTLGFMIPAVLSEFIVQAMSGKLDQDDDDQYLDDAMNMFFGGQFRTATAMFPIIGPSVQAGVNQFNDKWYDDRITTSPAVSAIESTVSSPHSVYKAIAEDGSKKRAARDTLTALGLLTGLPVAPISRPLGYLMDYADGKAEPKGPLDLARGLVSGKSGAAQ